MNDLNLATDRLKAMPQCHGLFLDVANGEEEEEEEEVMADDGAFLTIPPLSLCVNDRYILVTVSVIVAGPSHVSPSSHVEDGI